MSAHEDVTRRLRNLVEPWRLQQPDEDPAPLVLQQPRRRLSPKTFIVALAAVLAMLLVAGWSWWSGRPKPITVAPATVTIAETGVTGSVTVHVIGGVREPGTVTLVAGSRVEDAVEAAGGATKARLLESVNLARLLVDGEQIVLGEGVSAGGARSQGAKTQAGSALSLNQATITELDTLPGVGPVLAQRIVEWRDAHGGFRTIEDLNSVSGIGDATMAEIVPLVRL